MCNISEDLIPESNWPFLMFLKQMILIAIFFKQMFLTYEHFLFIGCNFARQNLFSVIRTLIFEPNKSVSVAATFNHISTGRWITSFRPVWPETRSSLTIFKTEFLREFLYLLPLDLTICEFMLTFWCVTLIGETFFSSHRRTHNLSIVRIVGPQ